ncbi:MAG TPA: peroxiredoxin [Candidatus Dormibacteraeota bacterium]|nr:peroxiredoxin [Candidatus Dormibacteraeota bacterium]
MLNPGDQVPDFKLQAGTGQTAETAELRGQRWVIYFYPKDNTPGCTIETGEFGRALPEFSKRNVQVFGCSVGDVEAKTKFAEACGAPDLPLLADPDHHVAELFGVWSATPERPSGGVARATFLVDAGGMVERVWETVRPAGHAAEVLAAVS